MKYLKPFLRQLISIIRYPKLFLFAKRMGENNRLGPGGRFLRPHEIYMGDNIYIAPGFHISARNLRIGNNVLIGPNLLLECDDHTFRNVGKTIWETYLEERNIGSVIVEDDVWIGGNVTILKNVIIGEGCIIGAGSVVTKSLPPYSVCFGIPCRPVKTRFTPDELGSHLLLVKSRYLIGTVTELWQKNGIS
jgi:acetyltransferase-like isoleucine patch superfamily enzyme